MQKSQQLRCYIYNGRRNPRYRSTHRALLTSHILGGRSTIQLKYSNMSSKAETTEETTIEEINLSKYRMPPSLFWGDNLTRPTFSFAIGSKLWSRERQYYEEDRRQNMARFATRPYIFQEYPELKKHYPGTWRVADEREVTEIVQRVTKPTWASYYRKQDILSAHVRSSRDGSPARRGGRSPDIYDTDQRCACVPFPKTHTSSATNGSRSSRGRSPEMHDSHMTKLKPLRSASRAQVCDSSPSGESAENDAGISPSGPANLTQNSDSVHDN